MEKLLGFCVILALVVVISVTASPLHRGDEDGPDGRSKRTFCNAFTGCGRKRSDGGSLNPRDYGDYNQGPPSSSGAGDRDRDPLEGQGQGDDGIEEVARDILAEARLWEALQARNSLRGGVRGPSPSRQRTNKFQRTDEQN